MMIRQRVEGRAQSDRGYGSMKITLEFIKMELILFCSTELVVLPSEGDRSNAAVKPLLSQPQPHTSAETEGGKVSLQMTLVLHLCKSSSEPCHSPRLLVLAEI